jgi:DNA-binding phage protein
MKTYRTIGEVEEQYLLDHPDEVDDYVTIIFEEYAESNDMAALLSSLSIVSRVKGVSKTKAFSESSNPKFGSINAIMQAIGYRLTPQKISATA